MKDYNLFQFSEALEALKEGLPVARKEWNWPTSDTFIFMQVPSNIPVYVIPNMTSLPQAVKKILIGREETLEYHDQFAKVDSQANITSYAISVEDVLADDWYIYSEE
jgi:hypothetical protein